MSKHLPLSIYRAAQVREMDRLAIEELGIPGYTLMSRAGEAAFRALRRKWPKARRLLVLCGAGNNAGDGYVLARMARAERWPVMVVALVPPDKLTGDARIAWETFNVSGGEITEWDPDLLIGVDVIVDAILGTGLARPLSGRPRELVNAVNAADIPVLAIDIPTGLHADTGHVLGSAVEADVTVTFIGLKIGLYAGQALDYTGEIRFDDLGISRRVIERVPCAGKRIGDSLVAEVLPRRRRTAHKGDHGHVLVVGGAIGMAGAARLAGEAALRAGAGLVTVATQGEAGVVAQCPELMGRIVATEDELAALTERADVIAIGPGLGSDDWARAMFAAALATDKPIVADADALNLLAGAPQRRDNWIMTPHPGEAGRLLGMDAAKVQADRFSAVAGLLERFGGVAVLKGAGTVVGRVGEVPWVCDLGNPGMATAGMGDVLTGIVAGIAAQTGDLFDAARAAVFVHAAAGDDAARDGERGLIASDLFSAIRRQVNPRP